jgi:hypothetical protein
MTTQSLRRSARDVRRIAGAKTSKSRLLRYQLNVIPTDVADLVQSVGGWLVDRAMAGWDVNVLVKDLSQVRPLQVLGIRALDFDTGMSGLIRRRSRPAGLAVAASLIANDERLHDDVRATVRHGLTEVALWGGSWPVDLGGPVDFVHYPISAAARVFKGQALAAAGLPDVAMVTTESLVRGGYRPRDSDLIPVS